jgi:hypothetical protein
MHFSPAILFQIWLILPEYALRFAFVRTDRSAHLQEVVGKWGVK